MILLVCGGRLFHEAAFLDATLDALHERTPVTLLLSGSAPGADWLAEQWARSRGVPVSLFPAEWARHGRAAGPLRNHRMLTEGKPELVVAFPGGRGTADMVKRARDAGVEVRVPKKGGPR